MQNFRQVGFTAIAAFACLAPGAAAAQGGKVLELLRVVDAEQLERPRGYNPVLTYNTRLHYRPAEAADGPWVDVTFERPADDAEFGFSAVFLETDYEFVVSPFDQRRVPDGSREWPNVWLGYDSFAFDYRNDASEPVRAAVLVQDFVSWLPLRHDGLKIVDAAERPQAALPTLYEHEVVLPPGRGTASIDLRGPLWCNDRSKGLGLDDVKAFGLCLRSPAAPTTLGVNRFRLESRNPDAGAWHYPERVRCEACRRSTSDRYAPFCPFCGAEVRDYQAIPDALPDFRDADLLLRAVDCGGGTLVDGNGRDATDRSANPRGTHSVAHYDLYYNRPPGTPPIPARKKQFWENRRLLKFALDAMPADKPPIKSATLWITGAFPAGEGAEPVFCHKPWLPALSLYSVRSEFDEWQGADLNFAHFPPFDKLIYVGGQHPGPAIQHPERRVPGKAAPRCLPLEITDHVREVVAAGRTTFSVALKAFTPHGAAKEPHGWGHHLNFAGVGNDRSPVIAIEFAR